MRDGLVAQIELPDADVRRRACSRRGRRCCDGTVSPRSSSSSRQGEVAVARRRACERAAATGSGSRSSTVSKRATDVVFDGQFALDRWRSVVVDGADGCAESAGSPASGTDGDRTASLALNDWMERLIRFFVERHLLVNVHHRRASSCSAC